jgi:hypothetical protein
MGRIFFEVSDLRRFFAAHGHPTGIQRVSLMLIAHVAARLGRERVSLAFLDFGRGAYQSLSLADLPLDPADPGALTDALVPAAGDGAGRPTLEKYLDRPLPYRFHLGVRELNAALGRESHFAKRRSSIAAWRASARRARGTPAARTRPEDLFAVARRGDTLVVLDAAWGDARIAELHRRASDAGLRVVLLVHDLCPILMPEFFAQGISERFEEWLRGTTAYTTRYLANSRSTADDLRTFLDAHGHDAPIGVMPLAQSRLVPRANPPQMAGEVSFPRVAGRRLLSDEVASLATRPFALGVGTLEIRKNLWALAQVWDRLRADPELDLPRLVLAGRPGWMNRDFENMMAATGHLGGWVRVLHGLTDAELDHLYRECLFTVCVSFKEGWGLPIGESLGYGKTAVVSGVSAMPEVGGDLVEYCDPRSLGSIESACRRLIADPGRRAALEQRIAGSRLRGWSDVADDLVRAIAPNDSQSA